MVMLVDAGVDRLTSQGKQRLILSSHSSGTAVGISAFGAAEAIASTPEVTAASGAPTGEAANEEPTARATLDRIGVWLGRVCGARKATFLVPLQHSGLHGVFTWRR